jgi:hypothetical protein
MMIRVAVMDGRGEAMTVVTDHLVAGKKMLIQL